MSHPRFLKVNSANLGSTSFDVTAFLNSPPFPLEYLISCLPDNVPQRLTSNGPPIWTCVQIAMNNGNTLSTVLKDAAALCAR